MRDISINIIRKYNNEKLFIVTSDHEYSAEDFKERNVAVMTANITYFIFPLICLFMNNRNSIMKVIFENIPMYL